MYEVINEKLKLESCSIGDLTLNIVNGMLKSWNDGSSISTLTIFYMPARDTMELGLFEIKESTVNNPDGSVRINRTTKVTGKGQQYFINKFLS